MVRWSRRLRFNPTSSPHPRGDGPWMLHGTTGPKPFSPPTWGWSAEALLHRGLQHVLPTHVGMVRKAVSTISTTVGSPHPRGDGPSSPPPTLRPATFSPPTWGWSGHRHRPASPQSVLPTHVGMVRRDVRAVVRQQGFSPPTWGWSADPPERRGMHPVLPTHVGMVRSAVDRQT